MFLAIALVLAVIWLLCVLVFKVTMVAIHLLLVLAVLALVGYFARRKAPPPTA
jgi:hypothetical protein